MENQIINFKCKYCGHNQAYKKENVLMVYAECLQCHEPTVLESKNKVFESKKSKILVKCTYCGSTDVKKISTLGRASSVTLLGLASKKIGKQFHCNNCGSDF